jgi:flagellar biogenesis protein FliO
MMSRHEEATDRMTSHRTSPPRLAAAIVGLMVVVTARSAASQDIPSVRPRSEVFGNIRHIGWKEDDLSEAPLAIELGYVKSNSVNPETPRSGKSPFSVVEPQWQTADTPPPRQLPLAGSMSEAFPEALSREPEPGAALVPVQSLELPRLDVPRVDPASARLVSSVQEVTSLPVLTAPEEAELVDPPAYAPKPASKTDASSDDLEGMLHGMLWITGTIGLGAVVSLWMLKLYLTRGGRTTLPSKALKLVDTLRIGPRCGVYLVQAETHRVLVGVEHGKTMCLMPLPEPFSETLDAAEGDGVADEPPPAGGFERVADVFSARRKGDERAKGAKS